MNLRQQAIIDCFGLEEYEEGKEVKLSTKEIIYGWYFMDANMNAKNLLEVYCIDEIEIIYSNAYSGQSGF